MRKTKLDYLRDLLVQLDDIAAFTDAGKDAFMQDAKSQKAVILSYELIGEIVKRLPAELPAANPQIDWRMLITFHDFLTRNDEQSALRYIWEAVEDLPALREAVEDLLITLAREDRDRDHNT